MGKGDGENGGGTEGSAGFGVTEHSEAIPEQWVCMCVTHPREFV